MFGADVRDWYLEQLATIAIIDAELAAQGVPLEERARRAWKTRHDARVNARERAGMADSLATAILRKRDELRYGQPDGPTFEQLVEGARKAGFSPDQAYLRIIKSSQKSNKVVNIIASWFSKRPPKKRPLPKKSPKRKR